MPLTSDPLKRRKVGEILVAQGLENELFLSLEEFFSGNCDEYSIAANRNSGLPSLREFRGVLERLQGRDDVVAVLIRVCDANEGESDWPYSDAAYVLGSIGRADLERHINSLEPDEIVEGWMYGRPPALMTDGDLVYTIWWD